MTKVRSVLIHSRDKLLNGVYRAILESEAETRRKLDALDKVVEERQLSINHHQMLLLEETNGRVKNSGIMHLSEREIVAKIFSGLKMYLDPRDVAVVPHLVLDTIWEHRITGAWLRVVGREDVVVDVGANFGYFSVLAAQLTDKKKSKVIMFEANPHLVPYLKKTLAVNWLNEQCVIENYALADKKGELTLYLLKDYIGSSSVHPAEELDKYMHDKMYLETEEEIKVPAISLDEYCKEKKIPEVNLIKMDIEGFEDVAYDGMRGIVKQSPAVTMFVEFTPQGYKDPEGFYAQMLEDFGYVYTIDDDGHILKPQDTSYQAVIGDADDWVMPIFSKRPDLATKETEA